MYIFDGQAVAKAMEAELQAQVAELHQAGRQLTIAAVLFEEDAGSQLYSRLKAEAASRIGMGYQLHAVSLADPLAQIAAKVEKLNADPTVTGIIIQKPWRKTWHQAQPEDIPLDQIRVQYQAWWHALVEAIDPAKDVDGLHPSTLAAIKDGSWQQVGKVLPATAQAVLTILDQAKEKLAKNWPSQPKLAMIGRSDIVGLPVFYALQHLQPSWQLELMGRVGLAEALATETKLQDYDIVISATGRKSLILGEYLKPGAVVIDVGEPQADVDWDSIQALPAKQQPGFITPVPGGVGPMTVSCLMGNGVALGVL